MNFKTFISLVVAASLGLAAVWVGRQLIFGQPVAAVSSTPMTKVVVAKTDLDPGQQITLDDLTTIEMPTGAVPANAFKDPALLKDRAVISAVIKGQLMFDALLAGQGVDGGLMALVPKGMRAVSVEVSESSGLAGLLVPGSRVDVIATLKQNDEQIAKTIVENVKVQAIGVKLSRGKNEDKGAPAAKTVTLIVTTKDAEAIELASNSGRPRLVLRGMADTDRTAGPGMTFAELSGASVPSTETVPTQQLTGWERLFAAIASRSGNGGPVVSQPVRWPVQIIRGNAESTIFYEVSAKPGEGSLAASPASADGKQNKDQVR
ncbi:MAG: Flp pilus assembly protein CpaB [Anaerolineae bacterium]|nr:Flp pilus assembly protein CpaB [Phycisphaerae bacterium]